MKTNPFPSERQELRAALLSAVDSIADIVVEQRDASEAERTLAAPVVEALRASPLIRMKAPREAGGAEAHPADQMDVIEAMVRLDPAAAWSMMITAAAAGGALSWLPDDVVAEITDRSFPMMAGSLKPAGVAERTAGGWRVSGRWGWASGVQHADYIAVPVILADKSGVVRIVAPTSAITVHDTWHVLGMKGTGSVDFSLDGLFVPDRFASLTAEPVRGGQLYRLGYGYLVNEHGAFAYALARVAISLVRDLAVSKMRGYGVGASLADRAVVQRAIGEGELRISATRLLMIDVIERLFDSARETEAPVTLQAEARAAAVLCTDEAIAVTTNLFRYAGGGAVMLANPLQRILRDLFTAQSHLVVSDSAYENLGRLRLGLTSTAPLS